MFTDIGSDNPPDMPASETAAVVEITGYRALRLRVASQRGQSRASLP